MEVIRIKKIVIRQISKNQSLMKYCRGTGRLFNPYVECQFVPKMSLKVLEQRRLIYFDFDFRINVISKHDFYFILFYFIVCKRGITLPNNLPHCLTLHRCFYFAHY